jgi:phosphotransferase system enzyme I (PtsI)
MQLKGIAASGGIALGKAFLYVKEAPVIPQGNISESDVPAEEAKLDSALQATREQLKALRDKAGREMTKGEAEVFGAHLMFLDDPEFVGAARARIREGLIGAAAAVHAVTEELIAEFSAIEDAYFRERAADVADVGGRIVRNILGVREKDLFAMEPGSVVIAHDLTPSETAQLNRDRVAGFALDVGGKTSHTAIMARSLELPAVLGLTDITQNVRDGQPIIVDGSAGVVIIEPDAATAQEYAKKREAYLKEQAELMALKELPAETADGHRVELAANIGNPQNADTALKYGAEGVGLYRTEFLFMDTDAMPGEDVQFEAYRQVLEKMGDRPVIIRTLDIGGDKKLAYLPMDDEMNPFLGLRAVRLCLQQPELFKTQLRAILRASAFGNALIMFPMISGVTEVRQAKAVVEECKRELEKEGVAYDPGVRVGIMVEIPSAAVAADIIAPEVDFFSIGTNDLCQYTLAVDRMNQKVSYLYDPFDPAILRLIKMVIDASHLNGIFTGMCGEMAGDEKAAQLLVGLGLDDFSMSPSSLLKVKKAIRGTTLEKAKELAEKALTLDSGQAVRAWIAAAE